MRGYVFVLTLGVFLGCLVVGHAQGPIEEGRLGLKRGARAMEISRAQIFETPLLPTHEPSLGEDRELVLALEELAARTLRDDFSILTRFLDAHPGSPWAMAVQTQLGHEYFRVGRYSRAIAEWRRAWDRGRSKPGEWMAFHANRAASELAMMHARLGRMNELRPLLAELERRPATGKIARHVRGAQDGLWSMEHRPEVSFRCGPLALDRICFTTDRARAGNPLIQNSQSTTNGFSAHQLAALSRQLGMNYQVAFRTPGAEIILPAVIHWKVGHYAALTARDGALLRAEDPTFGNSRVWLSDSALDEEASGYFLVRAGPLPPGWRAVTAAEAAQVWGKGSTEKSDTDETLDYSTRTCRDPHLNFENQTSRDPSADFTSMASHGMAEWDVHLLLASHRVEDTPLGYTPPVGPSVFIRLSYNSINGWPDFGLPYSNVSQEWRLNWVAYLTDDPMNPAGDIRFAANGGGTMTFTDFNPTNKLFRNLFRNRANLVRTGTNSYEIRYPNGMKQIFDQPSASAGTSRRIFMSAVVDPAGNAVTLQFDQPGRIASITDAIGQQTHFFYERPLTNEFIDPTVAWVPPFVLTRVVDPFGREATFDYSSTINARLVSITDALGMTSSFSYDYNPGTTDLGMKELTTPYGTTRFARGSYRGLYRANWVEITHPNGEKERIEYSENSTVRVPSAEPLGIVPHGVPVRNFILWGRNTYHWDRQAYAEGYAINDFSRARIYHWTHGQDYTTASGVLESFKPPLEHRVWFTYDGQVNPTFVGTSDRPTSVARTTEDGTTQLHRFEYNSLGNLSRAIDPLGREFTYEFSSNDVDVTAIRQTRAGANELLLSATYNAQHRPITLTDAAGQTTRFAHNARGQITAVTNALGHATVFSYDAIGYLRAVDGPWPGTNDTSRYTYDAFGRLRTVSDPDGYVLTFDYDALDRPTRVTYPDSTFEEITYDRLDPEVFRDRAGRETRLAYDNLRQLVAVEDGLGRVTRYQWCGCGNLDAVIDPLGRATAWIRDVQGRVQAKRYPDGSEIHYEYDSAMGWLKSVRDEQNQVTRFDYNLDGTLRQKRFLHALVPTPPVKLTYDPNYRRLLSREDGDGITTYGYNPIGAAAALGAGRLASIDGPLANDTITFAYDALGRESSRTLSGTTIRRSWDAGGRLTQMTNALGTFTYAWDGASLRLGGMTYPNGQQSSFSYFPNVKDQLLQRITHLNSDSSLISEYTYEYDLTRRITEWTQEQGGAAPLQWDFEYDPDGQLTNAVATRSGANMDDRSYAFDPAGNRVAQSGAGVGVRFTFNALNQLVHVTNGPALAQSYEWDAEGRLVGFNRGPSRTEFGYDGFGRRTRIVEKENGAVVRERRYVWCAFDLMEERDASGATVLKRFSSHGVRAEAGSDLPPGRYYFTRDGQESIREMTDASGVVRAAYAYLPFGERTRIAGDLEADFGFTGHFFHHPSGLGLPIYRAYDAALGRWLSRDPLGEKDDLNLYGYAHNDPVNHLDPLGLQNAANKLTQNLQGHKDAKAGLDAYHKAKKAGKILEKVVEKGARKTAQDLIESKRNDAVKQIVPGAQEEARRLTESSGETATVSAERLANPLRSTSNTILENIGGSGAPCAGGSSKGSTSTGSDDGWSLSSLWDAIWKSDPPKPETRSQLSETQIRARAANAY